MSSYVLQFQHLHCGQHPEDLHLSTAADVNLQAATPSRETAPSTHHHHQQHYHDVNKTLIKRYFNVVLRADVGCHHKACPCQLTLNVVSSELHSKIRQFNSFQPNININKHMI